MELLKFRIYGVYQDGTEDTWLIEGALEECWFKARNIIDSRNLKDYWSEQL